MQFTFTEEQQRFREEVGNFFKTTPRGDVDDRVGPDFSPELYRKVAARGWLGLTIPKEYGGQGRGLVDATIFSEEMAIHTAPVNPMGFTTHSLLFGGILIKHGTEQQKRYYLPRIASGEIWLGQAFTEANGGSDLLSNTVRAFRDGDNYIINGEKMFSSWAHKGQYLSEYGIRHYAALLARTGQNAPPDKSLSLFIFDGTIPLPGMSIRPIMTLGARTNEVFFDNVRLPAESLVGEENQAWDYVVESSTFYWHRDLGAHVDMNRILLELIQYVKETQIGGEPLSRNALVRHKLAEMAIGIEALRLHAYRLAWAFDKGTDITCLGSVTKFQRDQLALKFFSSAMQILGIYGQLEGKSKYAPLQGIVEAMYKGSIGRSFTCTGPSAMRSVIAGCVLRLPNEFGLIY